jgi:hypothetical protein
MTGAERRQRWIGASFADLNDLGTRRGRQEVKGFVVERDAGFRPR